MIRFKVAYNSQRNNINFKGKFSGWRQCFTSCAWMLMSYYSKTIVAGDDRALAVYLDDVEDSVGNPGIGEKIKRKYSWIRGNTSFWWLVQKHGIEKWLWKAGIKGNMILKQKMKFEDIYKLIEKGPVIVGTKRLGGLKGGHIILAVGEDTFHDPFGDANTDYHSRTGANVVYSKDMLLKHTGKEIICMYWKGRK